MYRSLGIVRMVRSRTVSWAWYMMGITCAYRMKMDCEVWRWMEAASYGVRCGISFSISNAERSVTTTLIYLKKYAEKWLRDYIVPCKNEFYLQWKPLICKKDKAGNVRIRLHVTLSRVREIIVAVESGKYYIFWVCFCSLSNPARKAHAPYCHMWHL